MATDPRYRTQRWRRLRQAALDRDGWVCTHPRCRADLHGHRNAVADHIIEVRDGGDFWSLDNLQSLCPDHHQAKTGTARAQRKRPPQSPNA